MKLIEANDLTVGYDNKKILQNINFSIEEGQYICVIGENGAGKSTLVKTILGLLKPISGQLSFENGLEQNQIGYISQGIIVKADFPATVLEIVRSGCLPKEGNRIFYSKKAKETSETAMEKMGITDLKNRSFRELSGGQRQRVLMARALCAAKKIIFLDEPVAGLDSETQMQLYKILRKLNVEGMTIVMISHDIDAVMANASHVLSVKNRKILMQSIEEYAQPVCDCCKEA